MASSRSFPRTTRRRSSSSRTASSRMRAGPRTRSPTSRAPRPTSRGTIASTGTTRRTSVSARPRTRSPARAATVRFADALGPARRWWNERGTPRWERRLAAGERPIEGQELLGPKELAAEALLLGLRTTAGDRPRRLAGALRRRPAGRERHSRRSPRGRGPHRRARRPGGRPVVGADAVRAGRCRRPGRGVRPYAAELRHGRPSGRLLRSAPRSGAAGPPRREMPPRLPGRATDRGCSGTQRV